MSFLFNQLIKNRIAAYIIIIDDSEGNLKVTGKEWAGIRLGHAGTVTAIEVDTSIKLKERYNKNCNKTH